MNSPDKKQIRRIGYITDQEGLMNRFFREGERWDNHLRNTREFIREAFKGSPVRSVGIMGSGWMLDVPLEELASRFDRVLLFDIHHPVEVRHKAGKFANVVLHEVDLTGGAVEYCRVLKKKLRMKEPFSPASEMRLQMPVIVEEPDALVSLNILNQLNGILLDFLQPDKYFQQPDIEMFSKKIQDSHIEWITRKPGCIITDVAEYDYDRKGREFVKSLLHTRLPEGKRQRSWIWDFDSRETYHPGMLTKIEIRAIEW